jgi:hypothetical protein
MRTIGALGCIHPSRWYDPIATQRTQARTAATVNSKGVSLLASSRLPRNIGTKDRPEHFANLAFGEPLSRCSFGRAQLSLGERFGSVNHIDRESSHEQVAEFTLRNSGRLVGQMLKHLIAILN